MTDNGGNEPPDNLVPLPEARRKRGIASLPDISRSDASRWVGIDPPSLVFTIEGLVPARMTTLLVAEGGAGKSLLAQTAMTCIVTADDFLGKETQKGSAAGLFAEDPDEVLHHRQARINDSLDIDMEVLTDRAFPCSYSGEDAALWRDGQPTKFLRDLEDQLSQIDELRLLVVDNVMLVFAGDPNSLGEVSRFVNYLNGLADRLDIGVVLVTHKSKSNDGSTLRAALGSVAWINATRSVLELRKDKGGNPELAVIKANHSAADAAIPLTWTDGLLTAPHSKGDLVKTLENRTINNMFLDLLKKTEAEGRDVSHSPNAKNYAPKVFAKHKARGGINKPEFEDAMERLFANGVIVAEQCGPPSRRMRRLVIKDADARQTTQSVVVVSTIVSTIAPGNI
jgi:RecA-family ATPase